MRRNAVGLYTVGVAALFLAGFFLLTVFGAQTYRAAASAQTAHNAQRAMLSYLSTSFKGSDRTGGVHIRNDDGTVLVLEDGSGYALHLYARGGELLEEYTQVGAPLHPEEAESLGQTETFSAREVRPGTLEVTTDAGRVLVCLRSAEGLE